MLEGTTEQALSYGYRHLSRILCLIKIDRGKVKAEEVLDGKYLLSTSDDSLSAEDIALGYKQLMEVERAFRILKSTLELRPVYHRKDERIRAHVLLCFLALVLVRIGDSSVVTRQKVRDKQ